jgi:predicted nuclease of restriction endonuclease-like RecB superfamily
MLSPDLVRAQRRGEELKLVALTGAARERAEEIALAALETATSAVGRSRQHLCTAWDKLPHSAKERRLFTGILKVVEDACDFAAQPELDAGRIRRALFEEAQRQRAGLEPGRAFSREAVFERVAAALELPAAQLDEAMYGDLRGEQRLNGVAPVSAREVLERYDLGQLQGVLLRAVRVTAEVWCAEPALYRRLFAKLKFRRLMHQIERLAQGGYRIAIDGPYSLFESVTKYGVELALVLPVLLECHRLHLVAELRWGKDQRPTRFCLDRSSPACPTCVDAPEREGALPEISVLVEEFCALSSDWHVRTNEVILDMPGVGICVPDLAFENQRDGRRVFLEVLGFWSRDAVWRRVELVQSGLGERVLFAVSSRLRVSEQVLEEGQSGALYVYKGRMSASAILRKIEALAQAPRPASVT